MDVTPGECRAWLAAHLAKSTTWTCDKIQETSYEDNADAVAHAEECAITKNSNAEAKKASVINPSQVQEEATQPKLPSTRGENREEMADADANWERTLASAKVAPPKQVFEHAESARKDTSSGLKNRGFTRSYNIVDKADSVLL